MAARRSCDVGALYRAVELAVATSAASFKAVAQNLTRSRSQCFSRYHRLRSKFRVPVGYGDASVFGLSRNGTTWTRFFDRSEEHTSELQSLRHLVCRLLLEKKKK